MKVVLKAALRECIKNLITFNQIGTDNEFMCINKGYRPHQTTPFSHQIFRFQRFVLFCGIKTKNSKSVPIKDRQDFLERSNACSDIVTNLQDLKQNKEIISQDKCKIELENIVQEYKRKIG